MNNEEDLKKFCLDTGSGQDHLFYCWSSGHGVSQRHSHLEWANNQKNHSTHVVLTSCPIVSRVCNTRSGRHVLTLVVGNRPTDGRVIFLPWLHFFLAGVCFFLQKSQFTSRFVFFLFSGGFGVGWGGGIITTQPLAPLLDLLLHFYLNLMLRCMIFSYISTWTWCSAAWSSLAFLPELDAPPLDLLLHFYLNLMFRCLIFSCISTWTWCSAAWSALAFLPELDVPLLDLLLHFNLNLMLRCLIFSCISTWTWCSAAWSSLTFLPELDAPLLDLLLHFYLNLMLRRLICSCISTWTWCSAAWSSLAFQPELDAPLLDLLLHFYLNLMLRCLIFSCISTWTWFSAAWSSLAFLPELDVPLLDLLFFMLPKRLLDKLKWPQQPFGEVAAIAPQIVTKLIWKKIFFLGLSIADLSANTQNIVKRGTKWAFHSSNVVKMTKARGFWTVHELEWTLKNTKSHDLHCKWTWNFQVLWYSNKPTPQFHKAGYETGT